MQNLGKDGGGRRETKEENSKAEEESVFKEKPKLWFEIRVLMLNGTWRELWVHRPWLSVCTSPRMPAGTPLE